MKQIIVLTLAFGLIVNPAMANQVLLERTVQIHNENRKTLPNYISLVTGRLGKSDKEFLEKVAGNLKELPEMKFANQKANFVLDGKKHSLEFLDSAQWVYLIDGRRYQDRPLGSLETRFNNINKVLNQKEISLWNELFINQAQADFGISLLIAAVGLFAGLTTYAYFSEKADFCEYAKNVLNTNLKVSEYTIVRSKDLRRQCREIERAFDAFEGECDPTTEQNHKHCQELTTKFQCSVQLIEELIAHLNKIKLQAQAKATGLHFFWHEAFTKLNERVQKFKVISGRVLNFERGETKGHLDPNGSTR